MASHDQEQTSKKPENSAEKSEGGASHDQEETERVYEFGDFRLYASSRLLYSFNGETHKLQGMPFRLFCVLVEKPGRELSNEELIRHLWAGESAADTNPAAYVDRLHHHVRKLRDVIGKEMIANRKKGGGYYFDRPVKVIQKPPLPPDPGLDFKEWIFYSRECRWIKLFLAAGVALSLLYSISYLLRLPVSYPQLGGLDAVGVLSLIQLAVVSGALLASISVFDRHVKEFPRSPEADAELMRISGYTDREKWARAKDGARSSLKQFSRYWKLLLVAWFCLYLLLTLAAYLKWSGADINTDWWLSIGATVFNNCNSWTIALCFVVFNHPTVFRTNVGDKTRTQPDGTDGANERGAEDEQDTRLAQLTKRLKVWGLLAIIAFAVVECLLVFYPLTQWFSSWTSENVLWAGDFFSGIVGAVTLALFVGRIQSKFLGPSTWLPLAFFLYVAIQSLYVAIKVENWGSVMIEAALILKCLMYLYVAWLFKSGRLLFYLVRVKTIYERVNIEWHDFLANLNREA